MLSRQRAEVQEFIDARDTAVAERDAALAELESLEAELEQVQAALDEAQADLENWKWRVASLQELGQTLEDNVRKMQATEARAARRHCGFVGAADRPGGPAPPWRFCLFERRDRRRHGDSRGDREAAERKLLALLEEADRAALARGRPDRGKERAIELAGEEHFFEAVDVLAADSRDGGAGRRPAKHGPRRAPVESTCTFSPRP